MPIDRHASTTPLGALVSGGVARASARTRDEALGLLGRSRLFGWRVVRHRQSVTRRDRPRPPPLHDAKETGGRSITKQKVKTRDFFGLRGASAHIMKPAQCLKANKFSHVIGGRHFRRASASRWELTRKNEGESRGKCQHVPVRPHSRVTVRRRANSRHHA